MNPKMGLGFLTQGRKDGPEPSRSALRSSHRAFAAALFSLVPKLHLGSRLPAKLGFANLERLSEWLPRGRSQASQRGAFPITTWDRAEIGPPRGLLFPSSSPQVVRWPAQVHLRLYRRRGCDARAGMAGCAHEHSRRDRSCCRRPAAGAEAGVLFLAVRLREGRALPEPRDFTKEEMDAWIAEDEADMESFRRGE